MKFNKSVSFAFTLTLSLISSSYAHAGAGSDLVNSVAQHPITQKAKAVISHPATQVLLGLGAVGAIGYGAHSWSSGEHNEAPITNLQQQASQLYSNSTQLIEVAGNLTASAYNWTTSALSDNASILAVNATLAKVLANTCDFVNFPGDPVWCFNNPYPRLYCDPSQQNCNDAYHSYLGANGLINEITNLQTQEEYARNQSALLTGEATQAEALALQDQLQAQTLLDQANGIDQDNHKKVKDGKIAVAVGVVPVITLPLIKAVSWVKNRVFGSHEASQASAAPGAECELQPGQVAVNIADCAPQAAADASVKVASAAPALPPRPQGWTSKASAPKTVDELVQHYGQNPLPEAPAAPAESAQ